MSAHGYIIGADGGGSKTAMLLAHTDGSEVARLTAGASNPTDLGIEKQRRIPTETAARLCAENGVAPEQVRAVFLGVAGGSHEGFCALTNEKLHRLFPNAKTAVSHDAVNIVYAAFPEEDGAAVISAAPAARATSARETCCTASAATRFSTSPATATRSARARTRSPASTAAPSRTRSMRWCGTIPARTCSTRCP